MIRRKNAILENNTKNSAVESSGTVLLGSNLRSEVGGQHIYGEHNDYTGDASTDRLQIGSGKNGQRTNALRVDKNGELILQGGGEVYMLSPDTGDIVPVYMLGSNNRIKKVYLSK